MNLGAWRLRNYSTRRETTVSTHVDNNIGTSLSRAIVPLKRQLTLGIPTAGDIFTSVQMRGVQLTSDEEMLPDSQRGFAPVIRALKVTPKSPLSRTTTLFTVRLFSRVRFEINDPYPTQQRRPDGHH